MMRLMMTRLIAAIFDMGDIGDIRGVRGVRERHAQGTRAARNARIEEFFVIPRRARSLWPRSLWPWPPQSAKRLLVAGGGLLLVAAAAVQMLLDPAGANAGAATMGAMQDPAQNSARGPAANRRTAPADDADGIEQKLADLSAAIAAERATALASMRGDYAAQTQEIERLGNTLAQVSEEFSQRLVRLQNLAERNAARLMAADAAPPAAHVAHATRTAHVAHAAPPAARAARAAAPRGRPPLRLAAIERRGQQPVAVVLLHGRRHSLREGQALSGYQVAAISLAERALTLFEPVAGKHYVLVAGTNYVAEYDADPGAVGARN